MAVGGRGPVADLLDKAVLPAECRSPGPGRRFPGPIRRYARPLMHVLWIATKCPVPPVDGGRLVQKLTLEALAARGVRLTLLAPVFPEEDRFRLYREASAFCDPLLVPVERPGPLATALEAKGPGRSTGTRSGSQKANASR